MQIFRIVCTLLVVTVIVACKKHSHKPDKKTLEELLTDGQWLLSGYGYDNDNNGKLDTDETLILECQKDNTSEYRRDGSGVHLENQVVCMADPNIEFEWKFIDNEKAIEISAQRLDIEKLTADELRFVVKIPGVSPNFHSLYRKQ